MSSRNTFSYKTAFNSTIRRIVGYGFIILLCVFISGLFFMDAAKVRTPLSMLPASMSAPKTPSAKAWGIFDPNTGEVLVGKRRDEPRAIASVTKLFVAASVLRSPKKDDTFSITFADLATEGRAGKLTYGEEVTPYTLLFPLLLESSNDAGEAIHRFLGDEYIATIRDIESLLTLKDTQISDASGLSPLNVSSVHDLALFYAYLSKNYPHILDITQLHTYVGLHSGYINNDPAREFPSFSGGKHGYTDEAGRTFVGSFTLPTSGKAIGIVLLGSTDIVADVEILLAYRSSEADSDIMTQ